MKPDEVVYKIVYDLNTMYMLPLPAHCLSTEISKNWWKEEDILMEESFCCYAFFEFTCIVYIYIVIYIMYISSSSSV